MTAACFGTGLGFNKQVSPLAAEGVEAGEAAVARTSGDQADVNAEGGQFNKTEFLCHAAIHATCVLYITVEIAPRESGSAFTCRTLGMILAMLLYGWTLAAPLILKHREF